MCTIHRHLGEPPETCFTFTLLMETLLLENPGYAPGSQI